MSLITPEEAGTLDGLFRARVTRTPDLPAYLYYDRVRERWTELSWAEIGRQVARWQAALAAEDLRPGDRVAVMVQNCPEWMMFDIAALANGLVVVPLYTQDRAENVAYVLRNAGVRLLLIGDQGHWDSLQPVWRELDGLDRILSLGHIDAAGYQISRLQPVGQWLPDAADLTVRRGSPDDLATIVYTSGTTGRPKGVMLSHRNILWNAYQGQSKVNVCGPGDVLLSFLPLSHTLERTAGYYLPMMSGAAVAYNRSISQLAEDLLDVRPTILISVPRIFERIYNKIQAGLEEKSPIARRLFELAVDTGWRKFEHEQGRSSWHPSLLLWPILKKLVAGKVMRKLGGRMKLAVVGGAPLSTDVAHLFQGLGLPMLQGYGLTETSPVISVNTLEQNDPTSVGLLLDGIEARIGDKDELQVRSPGVMRGYWDNPEATRAMIDEGGWLHTGDKARFSATGHLYITGRLKEILVLANGEKVPPADMEMAICGDTFFEQVMVVGDSRPYLTALAVLNAEQWPVVAHSLGLDLQDSAPCTSERLNQFVLERIARRLSTFPGYAQIRKVTCMLDPWTIENGLLTPTLKLKRSSVCETFLGAIEQMYRDH